MLIIFVTTLIYSFPFHLFCANLPQKTNVLAGGINSSCNPAIYCVFMPSFRRALVKTFFPCFHKEYSPHLEKNQPLQRTGACLHCVWARILNNLNHKEEGVFTVKLSGSLRDVLKSKSAANSFECKLFWIQMQLLLINTKKNLNHGKSEMWLWNCRPLNSSVELSMCKIRVNPVNPSKI